jgi:Kef-type K+ transport system membrane component KefB
MPDLNLIHSSLFNEMTAIFALAALLGGIGMLLQQPIIVSLIATGILAGPAVLGIVKSHEHIQLMAELGIAVLLFLVGLKLDLGLIRSVGGVALATGLGQVFFTSALGYVLAWLLGFSPVAAVYISVALTFSSTIIIVKLLSDLREVDSLHGRIAIGFLIVQDLVVVLAMLFLSSAGIGNDNSQLAIRQKLMQTILSGILLLSGVGLFIRFGANAITTRMAKSPELMIVFAIAWAALLAAICNHLGFSKEIGGLLAGISLASTPYREALVGRLASLRDFLLLFFFVSLGSQLELTDLGSQVRSAIVLSLFVLIGNPLIVLAIMGAMGYRKRTAFLAGLTVAQISEFSLIFMAMGLALGHVGRDALGLVTLVGLITISLSVYMITYSHSLYRLVEPVLGIFERSVPYRETDQSAASLTKADHQVVLFGAGRYGTAIAASLRKSGVPLLLIDFNPQAIPQLRRQGFDVLYGDACDAEFIAHLPLSDVAWVVAALPEHDLGVTHEDPRLVLINTLKANGFKGQIGLTTHDPEQQKFLLEKGADHVFLPFHDAAERAVEVIIGSR